MIKFGRNYKIDIETELGTTLEVTLPFTIEFDIIRTTLSSANICQVRLYNLAQVKRSQIAFNVFNQSKYRPILLKAGYGTNLTTIFSGNMSQAWSVREGVNFITQIECFDGGFAFVNGKIEISFPAGTPLQIVIRTLMEKLSDYGISLGAVGTFPGVLSKGNTYNGNIAQILFELTGGAFFIDNETAYALPSNEYATGLGSGIQSQPVVIINTDTGLLNTPVLEQSIIRFDMLFEPSLNVGRLANLISLTNPLLNGLYIVTSVKHRGIISESVAGSLITTVEFFYSKVLIPAV